MAGCSECVHFDYCVKLVGATAQWKECDWIPSKFQKRANNNSSGREKPLDTSDNRDPEDYDYYGCEFY
jgi:hypothetical protein